MALPNIYKATGIILKRTNSGEGDKILTVFCEHWGKKRFVGKGIRKITSKRSGHIELFSKTAFILHRGKILDYISGATVKEGYGSSYQSLSQLAVAYTASEVIDKLIMEGQEQDEAYCLLDRFLKDVGVLPTLVLSIRLKEFIDTILHVLGYSRVESVSSSLGNALSSVEQTIERKIRSIQLLSRSGVELYKQ